MLLVFRTKVVEVDVVIVVIVQQPAIKLRHIPDPTAAWLICWTRQKRNSGERSVRAFTYIFIKSKVIIELLITEPNRFFFNGFEFALLDAMRQE